MEIIKLPSVIKKNQKKKRSENIKKNRNAYKRLKEMMVPNELKLGKFRKYYRPMLSNKEKEILLNMGIDPWSIKGLKYVGDCKRFKYTLGNPIPDDNDSI